MTLCRRIASLFSGTRSSTLVDVSVEDAEMSNEALAVWARELGVTPEVMARLVEERRALVYDVAADPGAWGFGLIPRGAPRRDVGAEFRASTRLTGVLAESFLAGHGSLLSLVPRPLALPDGRPVADYLVEHARLGEAAATDLADHLRSTIQSRLGRALDAEAVEHAVRDAAWDHDLDVAQVLPRILQVLRDFVEDRPAT